MSSIKCFFAVPLQIRADFTCESHDHSCTEFVLNIGTVGWISEGQRRFRYNDGDVVIHQPGIDHWVENQRAGIHFCVGVNGADADALPVGVYRASSDVRETFEQINGEISENRENRLEMLDFLAGVLVVQLKRLIKPGRTETTVSSSHAIRAKNILDTQFSEPINLAEMASSLYISPDYLRQLFKETFGDSPMHYLIRKRIEYACEMLKMSDQPIQKIAASAGIDNPYYFSRIFKKVKGCTPSEYRGR